jgi:hypothetical protein
MDLLKKGLIKRGLSLALLLITLQPGPAALFAQDPPPAYPRPGATILFENDRVIVWNIAWLQQAYPVHRHRYDHVGVYYRSGDRIITSLEGERRPVSTEAWNISFQRRGVTHAEEGASAEPLRAVFIQIKDEPGSPTAGDSAVPLFPSDAPAQRLDNDRAIVWDYTPDTAVAEGGQHRHAHDAVVVSFDTTLQPEVRYLERGTVHASDIAANAVRTLIFEIR